MEPWKGQANALVGQGGEAAAKKILRAQGYEIVDSRWSCSTGEIDLIARRNRLFIFVEVKTSRSIDQAVIRLSQGQQRRIVNAAQIWLSKHAFGPQYLFRFDAFLLVTAVSSSISRAPGRPETDPGNQLNPKQSGYRL